MPAPKLVAPAQLKGIALARWHRGHKRLIGGAVTNAAYIGVMKKQLARLQRSLGNNRAEEQQGRAERSVLEKSTGKLTKPLSETWSSPANVPVVCKIGDLNLKKLSTPRDILRALAWLEKYDGLVYVLTMFSLENFTPECMQALVRVLQAKNIFSLNLGEAGKNLQKVHYEQLLRHLRTPAGPYSPLPASLPAALPAAFPSVLPAAHHASLHAQPRLPPCTTGARLVTIYLCDGGGCPIEVRRKSRGLIGKDRRLQTEKEARRLLSLGRAEEARALVPWRDPRVWKALAKAEKKVSVRWGHATWTPKKSWPELA